MQPPPWVQLDFDFSLLLLLTADVSLNPGPSVRGLCLRTANAHSIRDKAPALSDLVTSKGIDLLGITEIWLTTKETSTDVAKMTPQGFAFFHEPEARRRGGGVGLFVSSAHKFLAFSLPTQTSFEAISGKLECDQLCLIILHVYRPPGPVTFFSELQDILSFMSTLPDDQALMGNVNLCIDSSSSVAGQLSGILESFDLHKYIDFPTPILSHFLDLMICSPGCNVLSVSTSNLISDHFSVVADLQIPSNHSRTIPQTINYRKLQSINIEAFKADIKNSKLIRYSTTNANELDQQYDSVLYSLINLHVPLATRKISLKPPNPPWMTPTILASIQHRRYLLECVWRRHPTALNRSRLPRQTHQCQRQTQFTIPKLLLSILAIMGHYGRHLTKFTPFP